MSATAHYRRRIVYETLFVSNYKEAVMPISKSHKEDDEASEVHEAKKGLQIKLPAHEKAALLLHSGEEPLGQSTARITPKSTNILRSEIPVIRSGGAIISTPSSRKSSSSGSLS